MSYSTEKNMMLYLTGKQTEADVTVEELETITQQYPYFGAAKFLLAKKAQAENNAAFDGFAQGAVVHFANPYWFHFKLNEEQLMYRASVLSAEIKPGGTGDEKAPLTVDEAYKAVANVTDVIVNRQEASDIAQLKEDIEKEVITAGENILPAKKQEHTGDVDATHLSGGENKLLAAKEDDAEADEIVPAVSLEDVPLDKDDIVPAVLPEDVPLDKDDIVPAVEVTAEDAAEQDDIVPAVETSHEDSAEEDDIVPAVEQAEETMLEAVEASAIAEDEHPEGPSIHIPGTGENSITVSVNREETADVDEDDIPAIDNGPVSDKISAVLMDQLQEFKKPVEANAPVPIETEPYHTVDYFASQGIKLSLDQQKQDNLGVKVRKFTDWLKQMKRVSPSPVDLGIDEAAEHKVQTIAASSNEVKEVVTEAMAEVLAMQGMNDKAIQVYKKLSFLEPTKSAYFAAKIDNLKG